MEDRFTIARNKGKIIIDRGEMNVYEVGVDSVQIALLLNHRHREVFPGTDRYSVRYEGTIQPQICHLYDYNEARIVDSPEDICNLLNRI